MSAVSLQTWSRCNPYMDKSTLAIEFLAPKAEPEGIRRDLAGCCVSNDTIVSSSSAWPLACCCAMKPHHPRDTCSPNQRPVRNFWLGTLAGWSSLKISLKYLEVALPRRGQVIRRENLRLNMQLDSNSQGGSFEKLQRPVCKSTSWAAQSQEKQKTINLIFSK